MSAAKKSDLSLLARVWPYARRHLGLLAVVAVATPLGVLAMLAQPMVLKWGIDDHIAAGQLDGLGLVALTFVGVITFGYAAGAVGMYALQRMGLQILARLRKDVFVHVMGQGQRFFDTRTTGALMTRTTNDVEAVYESLAFGAVGLVTDALTIMGTLVAMLWLDWQLTLVSLSFAPIIVWVVNVCRKQLRVLFTEIRKSLSTLNGFFTEQINGMNVLQLYGAGPAARETFRTEAYSYLRHYRRANWWDAGLYAVMDGMSALAVGLLLGYAATRFGVDNGMTLGLLVAFIDYLNKVFVPIREFSGRIATIQRAIAALERVFDLADTHDQVGEGDTALPHAEGRVSFDGVSFGYGEDKPDVLHDVSFDVAPGEVVAIVGATGSGKSTLGKLLLRSYDGYRGAIRLDGHEIRDLKLADARQNVSVVHQDAHLFDATIAENIGLWSPDIDRPAVEMAAQRARADGFIQALAEGYDSRTTEGGTNLSGGQRQLLSIARAMARQAPVVILDEATSSVDSLTERAIDEAVEALFAAKTVLVIAHRLSTITKADRIILLHQGVLVEQGTHEALLARGGRYAQLVETGFNL
jgi:ATP-binding cassette subfamily B protein